MHKSSIEKALKNANKNKNMNPQQVKEELEAAKNFYPLLLKGGIPNPVNMFEQNILPPYNQIFADENLREIALGSRENEQLAIEAYEALVKAQDYLMTTELTKIRLAILPPQVTAEELEPVMALFSEIKSILGAFVGQADSILTDFRVIRSEGGQVERYLKGQNQEKLSNFLRNFNFRAKQLNQIKMHLIRGLKKQNKRLFDETMEIMSNLRLHINDLLAFGLRPSEYEEKQEMLYGNFDKFKGVVDVVVTKAA
jgi:hypothetical protein